MKSMCVHIYTCVCVCFRVSVSTIVLQLNIQLYIYSSKQRKVLMIVVFKKLCIRHGILQVFSNCLCDKIANRPVTCISFFSITLSATALSPSQLLFPCITTTQIPYPKSEFYPLARFFLDKTHKFVIVRKTMSVFTNLFFFNI